jgi:hypothetical protein
VESVSNVNSKNKELRWKTSAQLEEIFRDETESMKAVLPSRKHPRNAKDYDVYS